MTYFIIVTYSYAIDENGCFLIHWNDPEINPLISLIKLHDSSFLILLVKQLLCQRITLICILYASIGICEVNSF